MSKLYGKEFLIVAGDVAHAFLRAVPAFLPA